VVHADGCATLEEHARIAASVDRVLETWSGVGLSTLMAEIRGVPADEVVAILEALASAGRLAQSTLLAASSRTDENGPEGDTPEVADARRR
jgi:hypothetical protein